MSSGPDDRSDHVTLVSEVGLAVLMTAKLELEAENSE